MKYHFTVNERHYDVEHRGTELVIGEEKISCSLASKSRSDYGITLEGDHLQIKVLAADADQCVLFVGGQTHIVSKVDRFAEYKDIVGFENEGSTFGNEVNAPMPGKIIEILVEEGQEIKKDEGLIILEAMKMENVIKAPTSGKVSEVLTKVGDLVQKNDVIIKF